MGMGEVFIIALLGLLVLGPEKMPGAIRTVAQWIKSAKQMASSITSEIDHELKVTELHQNLKKAEQKGLADLSPELDQSLQELKDAAASVTRQYEAEPDHSIGDSAADSSHNSDKPSS
ncbi:MAG: sec-independent protein translocase protein TatB [Phenylobacterium sp.]|jgi:sec-independent protein translocase protein TatB